MPQRMGWSKYYVEKYTLNFPCLSNCPIGMTPLSKNKYKKNETIYFTPIRNQVHQIKNKGNLTAVLL